MIRFLLLFGAVWFFVASGIAQTSPAIAPAALPQVVAAQVATVASQVTAPNVPEIKFEDATDASGIHFTHSFGSEKLGSLLESTRWIDRDGVLCCAFILVFRGECVRRKNTKRLRRWKARRKRSSFFGF